MDENLKLGVIGVGKMGGIIVRSIANRLIPAHHIWITDLDDKLVTEICSDKGVNSALNIPNLLELSDVVLCAVPPVAVQHIIPQIASNLSAQHCLISIIAGVSTSTLESYFESPPPIVRVMPNIAASVEAAVSVLTAGSQATNEHITIAQQIFDTCGTTLIMDERHLNAVTGVSGSGPAYVALFVEALADAGVHEGIPRQDAQILAIHTVLGSAKMLAELKEHPAIMKNRVTTPGGTTAAGLHELENGRFRTTIAEAVIAASQRAKELGTKK